MTATAAKPRKPGKPHRPVYLDTVKAIQVDPRTGEMLGPARSMLAPQTQWDERAIRERGFSINQTIRADLKKPRNVKFWRLAHVLGAFLADNVEGFEGLSMHDALKRLQELSNIGCTEETFDLGTLGIVKRRVAESLNFDDMDDGRWSELWTGWVEWLRREKWGALSPEQLETVEQLILGDHQHA